MKFIDIKNKTEKELHDLLGETRGALAHARFQASERQLKDVRKIRTLRKQVAQVLTALRHLGK